MTVNIYNPRLSRLSFISSIAANLPAIRLQIPMGENLQMLINAHVKCEILVTDTMTLQKRILHLSNVSI